MLANIIIRFRSWVLKIGACETRVWHILLVEPPSNALVLEKIRNGRNIARDQIRVIVVDSEVLATNRSDIVRLAGVSDGEVIREGDALARDPQKTRIAGGFVVVGVFEPDGHEAVEGLAGDGAYGRPSVAKRDSRKRRRNQGKSEENGADGLLHGFLVSV